MYLNEETKLNHDVMTMHLVNALVFVVIETNKKMYVTYVKTITLFRTLLYMLYCLLFSDGYIKNGIQHYF